MLSIISPIQIHQNSVPMATQESSQSQQSQGCFIPNLSMLLCMPAGSTPTDLQWPRYGFPSDQSTTFHCFSKTIVHCLACFPPPPLKFVILVPGLSLHCYFSSFFTSSQNMNDLEISYLLERLVYISPSLFHYCLHYTGAASRKLGST